MGRGKKMMKLQRKEEGKEKKEEKEGKKGGKRDKRDKKGLLCKREKRAFPEDPAPASVQSLSKPKRVFRPCAARKKRCQLASHDTMFGW